MTTATDVVSDDTPDPDEPASEPTATVEPKRPWVRISTAIFGVVLVVLISIASLWLITGGRYYIVTTPSMSPVLPVGALALTQPYAARDVRLGTIIAFQPPYGPPRIFMHRVVSVTSSGYVTKGDANPARDPWPVVPFRNVKGVVVQSLPGVGWVVKAMPWFVVGIFLAILLAAYVPWRWGVFSPLISMVIIVTVPLLVLRPLVRGELIYYTQTNHLITARVVNTGLLPLVFTPEAGRSAHVSAGYWTDMHLPQPPKGQRFNITATVDLSVLGWIGLILLCLTPLIIGIVVTVRERNKEKRGQLVVPQYA